MTAYRLFIGMFEDPDIGNVEYFYQYLYKSIIVDTYDDFEYIIEVVDEIGVSKNIHPNMARNLISEHKYKGYFYISGGSIKCGCRDRPPRQNFKPIHVKRGDLDFLLEVQNEC